MNSEEKNFTADNLSMTEKKIAQILAGLPRVEAPGDFEIGVRARIANAQPSRPRRFSTAAVIGFAAPAILVLAPALVLSHWRNLGRKTDAAASRPPVNRLASPMTCRDRRRREVHNRGPCLPMERAQRSSAGLLSWIAAVSTMAISASTTGLPSSRINGTRRVRALSSGSFFWLASRVLSL